MSPTSICSPCWPTRTRLAGLNFTVSPEESRRWLDSSIYPKINEKQPKMLIARLRNLTTRFPFSSSSSLLKHRLFSHSSPSPTDVVSGSADVAAEEDLLYSDASISSAVKPATIPILLQPRVVVYDGVCHLCHRGSCSHFSLSLRIFSG